MVTRPPEPHLPSSATSDDLISGQTQGETKSETHSRVSRPNEIRFPSFSKRHASIDSPREVPLPSPSLRQETISPFSLAWDSMETPSPFFSPPRLNETVSNTAQGSTSRPSTPSMAASVPLPKSPTLWPDNSSSSSLPEPSKIPFHMLSRAGAHGKGKVTLETDDSPQSITERLQSSDSSSSSSSSSNSDVELPPLDACVSSSSGSSSSIESIASGGSSRSNAAKSSDESVKSSDFHGNVYSSTFTSYASNGLGSAYAKPTRPPSPSLSPYLSRHMSVSSRFSRPSSNHSASSGYYMYPPEPPIILPPEPDDDPHHPDAASQNGFNYRRPHLPFLSRGPPPADSYIEVETTARDYRLLVKLPGFTRDGITLASKKRRILHIVADRWDVVGGHFERRISFGYDADLMQVRAEFDGEMLRVIVPRRPISVAANG